MAPETKCHYTRSLKRAFRTHLKLSIKYYKADSTFHSQVLATVNDITKMSLAGIHLTESSTLAGIHLTESSTLAGIHLTVSSTLAGIHLTESSVRHTGWHTSDSE